MSQCKFGQNPPTDSEIRVPERLIFTYLPASSNSSLWCAYANTRLGVRKCLFRASCALALDFRKTVHKLKISKDHTMRLWKLKCLNLLRNGSSCHWFWKPDNRRFYQINVIWPRDRCHCRWRPYALFCGSRLTLFKKMYRDSGRFVFHGVSLVKDRAVY